MSANPKRGKHYKRKFFIYILLLGAVVVSFFYLSIFLSSRRPLFISPVGTMNADKTRIEKILKKNKILFSDVILTDSSYLVNLQNNGQVKLSQTKNIDEQIASLQRILRELTIEGKAFKSIDFRFSEPVVSF